ncbi:MAG: hypothetical protein AB7P04_01880 [Bacteriovoracia bacterium]
MFRGTYQRKGWVLLYKGSGDRYYALRRNSSGVAEKLAFEITLATSELPRAIDFIALGPHQQRERLTVYLQPPRASVDQKHPAKKSPFLEEEQYMESRDHLGVGGVDGFTAELFKFVQARQTSVVQWQDDQVPMTPRGGSIAGEWVATLNGKFLRKDWALLVQGKRIASGEDRNFSITWPIKDVTTSITLQAIGPGGEVQDEEVVLDFPQLVELNARQTALYGDSPWQQRLSLGAIQVAYYPYGYGQISEYGLDLRYSASYALTKTKEWRAQFGGRFTPLMIAAGANEYPIRFYEAALSGTYAYPWFPRKFQLRFQLGGRVSGTLSSHPSDIGYRIVGAQFIPEFAYFFPSDHVLRFHLKWIPITNEAGWQVLNNREIAAGMELELPNVPGRSHHWGLYFEYAHLSATQEGRGLRLRQIGLGARLVF